MKTKIMKVLAIGTLGVALAGTAGIFTVQTANAEAGFTMKTGASVRVDETANASGIRFVANVADLTDKDYRMLILPTAILKANEIAATDDIVAELKTVYGEKYESYFVDLEVTPFAHEEYGNVVMAAMNEIPADYYADEYTGIAYYVNEGANVYASFEEGEDIYTIARSVSYVASAALNSGEYAAEAGKKAALESFVAGAFKGDGFALTQENEYAKIGDEILLTQETVTGLEVKYASSNTAVAAVDGAGKVTVVGKGNAKITASIGDTYTDEVAITAYTGGVKSDMLIADDNYTKLGTEISKWYTTSLETDVKSFAENQVKPYAEANSYIEYSLTATAKNGREYPTQFMLFNSTKAIPAEYANIDWNNAYVKFWLYNDTDYTVKLFRAQEGGYNTQEWRVEPAAKTWTQVTMDLKTLYGVTQEVFNAKSYNIGLYAVYSNTGCHTDDTYQNFAGKFYVAGFEFMSPDVNEQLALSYTNLDTKWYDSNIATQLKQFGTEKPYDGASTYIEYTITTATVNSNMYIGNFLAFNSSKPIPEDLYNAYKDIDWSNASMSFWAYNNTDYPNVQIRVWDTVNEKYGNKVIDMPTKQWTKVTVSLKDFFSITSDPFAASGYNINLCLCYQETGCHSADTVANFLGSFYMAGFEFVA